MIGHDLLENFFEVGEVEALAGCPVAVVLRCGLLQVWSGSAGEDEFCEVVPCRQRLLLAFPEIPL